MENFNFGHNTFHKGKKDGVDNRGERKQVMTVGVDSKGGGEGGTDNRAREGRMTVATATKGTIVVTTRETILNSLITGVTFEEIMLSGSGISMKTLTMMAILIGLG